MTPVFFYLQIIIIATLASIACAIPGVLLVVRGIALMSDAMSHSVLLGIVIAFLCTKTVHSPFIFLGAIIAACTTVFLTEKIIQSKRLKQDAAVGLIFPCFFSIAIILISQYTRAVHLDTDMILTGEILLAPLKQYILFSHDIGPQAAWSLIAIVFCNSIVVYSFFRGFQLTLFDPINAQIHGYNPRVYHYLLMVMTSITTVFVFDIVGTVLCVALIIVPAATAYLFAKSLKEMFLYGILSAIFTAIIGTMLGLYSDVSIAGSIASIAGFLFFLIAFTKK